MVGIPDKPVRMNPAALLLRCGLMLLALACSPGARCQAVPVKLYFDQDWRVCKPEKASCYRICGWDTTRQFFEGKFSDYRMDGTRIASGNYRDGRKNGEFVFSDETGAEVLILDGLHGRSGQHADMDYFEIMYENLNDLSKGLEVSG